MNKKRITQKRALGGYELASGNEYYGWEDGIRLVQYVGRVEDILEKHNIDNLSDLDELLSKLNKE